jgi:hypothetical protein
MTKPHLSNPRVRREIRGRQAVLERAERTAERQERRARLTDVERAERAMTELDLQRLLVGKAGLAPMLGWEHVHVRAGLRSNGQYRVATSGSMAAGWPDLVLVRARDRRLIFAELKRELEQPRPEQERVLDVLRTLGDRHVQPLVELGAPKVEVHVWRPSDLRDPIESSRIYQVLR